MHTSSNWGKEETQQALLGPAATGRSGETMPLVVSSPASHAVRRPAADEGSSSSGERCQW